VIRRELRVSENIARIYVAEIILALEALHKRDIVFRDLKPDNVVLDEDGHALLTDFGLSKEGMIDNILTKSFCGSVAYMAPEVLKKAGHGKSVDWYLLGVLLYELVVGQIPYFNRNREQLFKNIQEAKLQFPDFLSVQLKNLLGLLLERNPQKRLGAGKEDAEEIKRHAWFTGLNWEDVLQRKLTPPKPRIRSIPKVPQKINSSCEPKKGYRDISGWNYKDSAVDHI